MRRTYVTLAALSSLAILAAIYYAIFAAGLISSGSDSVTVRLTIIVLSQVCALLFTVTLALAVVVAAWKGRADWLVLLVILGALGAYWIEDLHLVSLFLPSLIFAAAMALYPFGPLALAASAPVIAASVALIFAIRGASAESQRAEPAHDTGRVYRALAIIAGAAIVVRFASLSVTKAYGALGQVVLEMSAQVGSALLIGAVVAAIAVAAWKGRKGWLVALSVVAGITMVFPVFIYYPLLVSPPGTAMSSLFLVYNSPYTQAALAAIPCALAMVFGLLGRYRASAGVAGAM